MGSTFQWSNEPTIILLDLIDELNVTDDVIISINDISKDETEGPKAVANSKAAGLDIIHAELLKWQKIASIVWNTLKVPCELNFRPTAKLQKRGNLPEYDHWRAVTFFIIVRKMLYPVLLMVRKAHTCKTKRTAWLWTWRIFQWTYLYPTKHYCATIRILQTTDYHLCRLQNGFWEHLWSLWKILNI